VKVGTLLPHTRFQLGFSGVLVGQRALPHHQLSVPLCGSRQGWIPVERAKAVLSTVLVGSFHQLRGFHGLGAGVNQRTGGPNSAEQISTDQLPHGRFPLHSLNPIGGVLPLTRKMY
jgi:hypothetical protein